MKQEQRQVIATLGGFNLITNYPPHIWSNGIVKTNSISFDKPKMYGLLMDIVEKVEREQDLIIEIKRSECVIKKMHLTRNETIISVDGEGHKQRAVFNALAILGGHQ